MSLVVVVVIIDFDGGFDVDFHRGQPFVDVLLVDQFEGVLFVQLCDVRYRLEFYVVQVRVHLFARVAVLVEQPFVRGSLSFELILIDVHQLRDRARTLRLLARHLVGLLVMVEGLVSQPQEGILVARHVVAG